MAGTLQTGQTHLQAQGRGLVGPLRLVHNPCLPLASSQQEEMGKEQEQRAVTQVGHAKQGTPWKSQNRAPRGQKMLGH